MDNYEPPGFLIIRIFQSVTGICYWKYSSIAILNAIVLLVTITLSVLLILLQIPCLIICSYGATTLYDVFNISSGMFSLFLTSMIQTFVCIFNMTSFVLWAQDIKKFFARIRVFSKTFHLELQPPQETRLLSTSIKLIFFVLLAVFVQVMVYLFVYHPDLYDTQNSNDTLIDLRPPALTGVNFQRSVQIIEGVMKFKITADSYASVTIYLYFMQLVTLTIKRVELRFEKFVYVSSKRMIEGAKVTFIEVQNVLDDIDKLFGSTTAFTLMAHFSIHLIGLVQLSRGFIDSNSRRIAFYGLVNSILGLVPLYLLCTAGDQIQRQMKEVIQSLSCISHDACTEEEYRAFSILVSLSNGNVKKTVTAGGWIPLTRKTFSLALLASSLLMASLLTAK